MTTPKKLDVGEEVVRLLVVQLRQSMKTQTELILELDKAGFGQSRIADLVATTPGAVSVTLAKARKRAGKETSGKGESAGDES